MKIGEHRSKGGADHVVIDANDNTMKCLNCGDSQPTKLPDLVTLFVARMRAFEKMHRHCRPAPPTTPEGTKL